jgi:hypothetical protein
MKRTSITAVLAALVLLAGCSSGNGSSSGTTLVPPSVSSSVAAPSTSSSAGTTTSTAVPAGLDAASTTWFDALCTTMLVPLNNIQQAHIPSGSHQSAAAGDDLTQQEADRQARIKAVNQAAATLATTPPPGFDGGEDYAVAVTKAIHTTAAALAAHPEQAADLSPSGPFHPLEVAIGQVDSTVRNYALLIPSCNAAGGLAVDYQNSQTTTAAPADLDAASAKWFDVMCTALGPVGVESHPSTAAELLTLQQKFATTISQTAAALATTPPPGFDGGAEWAASVIAVLQSSSATMTAALAQSTGELAALDPNDQAALESFKTKVSQPPGFKDAYTVLATMDTQVDPSVAAAVRKIASCASIGL